MDDTSYIRSMMTSVPSREDWWLNSYSPPSDRSWPGDAPKSVLPWIVGIVVSKDRIEVNLVLRQRNIKGVRGTLLMDNASTQSASSREPGIQAQATSPKFPLWTLEFVPPRSGQYEIQYEIQYEYDCPGSENSHVRGQPLALKLRNLYALLILKPLIPN